MIKSERLSKEEILEYKTDVWIQYSMFNLNWMDELEIKPKIIFDVGCNNGGDSIRFKKQWPDAEVHAFEADPNIYNKIKGYMKEENVNLLNVGVSNEEGELEFYPASSIEEIKSLCAWGTFVKSHVEKFVNRRHKISWLNPIKVKTISLHTYCQQNNIKEIDLLHVDAEGWDFNVIKGLSSVKTKVIYIEQHPAILTKEEINEFHNYMEKDYVLQDGTGCDFLYINKEFIHQKTISFLIPTRKRIEHLCKALDSMIDNAKNIKQVEVLLRIDNDDEESKGFWKVTNDNQFTTKYKNELDIKIVVGERGDGYGDLNVYWNKLTRMATGKWVNFWTDDVVMITKDYDVILDDINDNKVLLPQCNNEDRWSYPFVPTQFIACVNFTTGIQDAYWNIAAIELGIIQNVDIDIIHNDHPPGETTNEYLPSLKRILGKDDPRWWDWGNSCPPPTAVRQIEARDEMIFKIKEFLENQK